MEADPKFALGHVGLAQAYLQRVDRFDGDAFLVDSAIDLCQRAIELDPDQVRAYTTLGLAFDYKGMDEEAGKQIAHALTLAPNDATANSRAAYEAAALGHVSDDYALLFKTHQLAPKDSAPLYDMAAICAWTGEREMMEKWMAAAIALEADPDRRALLQAERFVFRGNWQNAVDQLRKLPLEFKAYGHTVSELLVACSAKLADWNSVEEVARTKLGAGADVWDWKMWGLAYLALADQGLEKAAETKTQSEALVNYIQQKFVGREISHWEAFYLAVGERLLGNKEEAYARLRPIFSPAHRHVPLMGLDPLLSPFQQDPEYQDLMNQLQGEMEKTKGRIHESENVRDSVLQTS
jgi:tetratricopeptide (TPR) repeat protein